MGKKGGEEGLSWDVERIAKLAVTDVEFAVQPCPTALRSSCVRLVNGSPREGCGVAGCRRMALGVTLP